MIENSPYIVLARKYRPKNFGQLIGQNALVKIINNSIKYNRIAHAFLLTGIRGIGKTTTARIIAKTINCTNLQENNSIFTPCEKCKNCLSCNSQNHPDIIELDAASKTGVGDIREIIENASYGPIMAKYKVYIIDEIHMLSNNAFNALLKTLEEPPAHLKFIFATTEYRKIPLTIVSRCQKYDLRRFTIEELEKLLTDICKQENISYEKDALRIIAVYAQGSARDSLSLLDMIILHAQKDKITNELVEKTLGITNKANSYKLFKALLKGDSKYCLTHLLDLIDQGIEPLYLLEDLLDICTNSSKVKASEEALNTLVATDFEKQEIKEISNQFDIPRLSRVWQILFKGINELKNSDLPIQTVEMLFIRICYLSTQPTPAEILAELKKKPNLLESNPKTTIKVATRSDDSNSLITNYAELAELFRQNKEMMLYYYLKQDIKVIDLKNNHLKIRLINKLDTNIIKQIKIKLENFTRKIWQVEICSDNISDNSLTLEEKELADIKNHEIIKAIFDNFNDAKLEKIKTIKTN